MCASIHADIRMWYFVSIERRNFFFGIVSDAFFIYTYTNSFASPSYPLSLAHTFSLTCISCSFPFATHVWIFILLVLHLIICEMAFWKRCLFSLSVSISMRSKLALTSNVLSWVLHQVYLAQWTEWLINLHFYPSCTFFYYDDSSESVRLCLAVVIIWTNAHIRVN